MSMCIGFLEYISVGKGIEAADLISKNTAVDILLSSPNCPGRYQILFTGDVDAVQRAVELAEARADFNFLDSMVIPRVEDKLVSALYSPGEVEIKDGIAIFEAMTMTAVLEGADAMVKAAEVDIVELRLGKGLAGKSFVTVTGALQDLRAGMDAALDAVKNRGVLISSVILPSVDRELVRHLTG